MKTLAEAISELRKTERPTVTGDGPPRDDADLCPICSGAGWLRNDVPVGHPLFGQPVMCECLLAKREEREFEELLSLSNLEPFRHLRFDNFDQSIPGIDLAFRAAKTFAKDPRGWLVFVGRIGCGKTHLAAAIANEAIRRRSPTLFVVVPELLDHLRATFFPTSNTTYDELFERVRNVPLLVLDDLGTESSTPWAQEKMFQIVNRRYNLQLPTVITTNKSFKNMDDRVVSRMTDYALAEVIEVKAESYRDRQMGQRRKFGTGATSRGRRQAGGAEGAR